MENIRNLKNKTIKDSVTGKNLFYRSFQAHLFFREKQQQAQILDENIYLSELTQKLEIEMYLPPKIKKLYC